MAGIERRHKENGRKQHFSKLFETKCAHVEHVPATRRV